MFRSRAVLGVDERLFPIDEMGYSTVTVSPIRSDDEDTARLSSRVAIRL